MEPVTLFSKDSKGVVRSWTISTAGGDIEVTWGQIDGAQQTTVKAVEQKNIGKSNETNLVDQAEAEALATIAKQLRRKYFRTLEELDENQLGPIRLVRPMLAETYDKEKPPEFPIGAQFKLDGHRMMAWRDESGLHMVSKGNKPYTTLSHIKAVLEDILEPGILLDGELYVHGVPFETLTSWIKKERPETENVRYCVYDLVHTSPDRFEEPWDTRHSGLGSWYTGINHVSGTHVISILSSLQMTSQEHLDKYATYVMEQGYEGLILRIADAPYKFAGRSKGLLKVKLFEDAEFKLVGVKDGVGKFVGLAIFLFENEDGSTFEATPRGTAAERRGYFDNAESAFGSLMTVRFMGRTINNLPRHATVLRAYEAF